MSWDLDSMIAQEDGGLKTTLEDFSPFTPHFRPSLLVSAKFRIVALELHVCCSILHPLKGGCKNFEFYP